MNSLPLAVQRAMTGAPAPAGDAALEADFYFGPDFAGFDGHFPGDPMLPGIAQIMAVALTARPDGWTKLLQVGRTKFSSIVRPGMTMRVHATLRETETGLHVTGDCSTKDGPCAQVKIVLDR